MSQELLIWGSLSCGEFGTFDPQVRERECLLLLAMLEEAGLQTTVRRYEAGATVCDERGLSGVLLLVISGVLRREEPRPGGKTHLTLLGSGDTFGHPLTGWRRHPTLLRAATGCEVTRVTSWMLEEAVRRRPEVASVLVALGEYALVDQQELLNCLLRRETGARLARLLLLLAAKFGEPDGDSPASRIGVRLTQRDLANMVASSRESVSSAVRTLRFRGLIEMKAQRVCVLDLEGLAEYPGRCGSPPPG